MISAKGTIFSLYAGNNSFGTYCNNMTHLSAWMLLPDSVKFVQFFYGAFSVLSIPSLGLHDYSVVIPANKEPFLNQLTHVTLVHNWCRSTSMCFHVYSRAYTCSACYHEFWTSLTRVVLGQNCTVSLAHVITWTNRDFTGNTCRHTKFVHRIWWIHVNWASWTREFTYRTCEITGRCLLGFV